MLMGSGGFWPNWLRLVREVERGGGNQLNSTATLRAPRPAAGSTVGADGLARESASSRPERCDDQSGEHRASAHPSQHPPPPHPQAEESEDANAEGGHH